MTCGQVADELSYRLTSIFVRDEQGRRPVFGGNMTFQNDEDWRDYVPFHEYFHGDNGAGVGASHQTRWTALGANFLHQRKEGESTGKTGNDSTKSVKKTKDPGAPVLLRLCSAQKKC